VKVFVFFVVEKDGTVSNVTVVKGAHPLLNAEAKRVVQSSPKWTPGFGDGESVRVRFSITCSFALE